MLDNCPFNNQHFLVKIASIKNFKNVVKSKAMASRVLVTSGHFFIEIDLLFIAKRKSILVPGTQHKFDQRTVYFPEDDLDTQNFSNFRIELCSSLCPRADGELGSAG